MNENTKDKKPEIGSIKIVYMQESDSCDDNDLGQELTIEIINAGAGHYPIISTKRWSMNSANELTELIDKAMKMTS